MICKLQDSNFSTRTIRKNRKKLLRQQKIVSFLFVIVTWL